MKTSTLKKSAFLLMMTIPLLTLPACQRSAVKTIGSTRSAPSPSTPSEFSPALPISSIAAEQAKYPDLFSPECYAVWVSPNVAEEKRHYEIEQGQNPDPWLTEDAAGIMQNFIIIEVHTESVFGDTSIAYDVVGLRNVSAYLETPDGRRIEPIQRILGTPVEEEQRGALKAFRRTNVLVFPRRDIWSGDPVVDKPMPFLKLILESHDSRFAFQWPDVNQQTSTTTPTTPTDRLKLVKVGFTEIFTHLRRLNRLTQ